MGKREEQDIDVFRDLAIEAINGQQWERARVLAEHILTITPDDSSAHSVLGMALLWLNDLKRAERHLRMSIGMGEGTAQNHNLLAQVYARRGDLEGQLRWAKKAIECDEEEFWPYLTVADAYLRMERFTEAEDALHEILKRDPKDVDAHTKLGRLYLATGRQEEAEEEFGAVVEERPDEAYYWANLGYALCRGGKLEAALDAFREALTLHPRNPTSYYDVGDAYLAMGKPDKAIPFLTSSVKLDPDNSLGHYSLGLAFLVSGRHKECEWSSKEALRNDPEMRYQAGNVGLGATTNLAVSYIYQERYKEAEACLRKNLTLFDTTYFNLGLAQFRQRKFEESLTNFQRALEIDPDNPEYLDMLANAYMELGRLEEAKEVLEQALAVDGNYALAHYDLGVVLARMRKNEEALPCFKRALALNKNLMWAYYSIACIHALQGERKPALQFLEKAFQKGFSDEEYMEKDTDLDSLRDDPGYRRLKAKYLAAG